MQMHARPTRCSICVNADVIRCSGLRGPLLSAREDWASTEAAWRGIWGIGQRHWQAQVSSLLTAVPAGGVLVATPVRIIATRPGEAHSAGRVPVPERTCSQVHACARTAGFVADFAGHSTSARARLFPGNPSLREPAAPGIRQDT